MLTLIKRIITAAALVAAMATPTAAYAHVVMDGPGAPDSLPVSTAPAVPSDSHAAASASPGFQWGDAGVGAGALLVLIGVGAGTAVVYRRRAHRPLAN